jgi:mRNA-degrading endonuclease toxin of MazEF toxin-antitoxin module
MTLGKRISAISSEGNNALSRPALSGKIYPFEVFIPQGTGGLDRDSKIMLDQIRSLDKRRLRNKIGAVSHDILIKASAIAQRLISVE